MTGPWTLPWDVETPAGPAGGGRGFAALLMGACACLLPVHTSVTTHRALPWASTVAGAD